MSLTGHLPALAGLSLLASHELDSVRVRDARRPAAQLLSQLERPDEWRTIPGLLCRDLGPPAAATTGNEPDLFLFPVFSEIPLFPVDGYATVEGSRGCYHACAFCLPAAFYRQAGVPYRVCDLANLMQGVEALYARDVRLFPCADI